MSRPILLSSCARAATAAEARFRIDMPISPSRGTRVVALDAGARPALRTVAAQQWANARFYLVPDPTGPNDGWIADIRLRGLDGGEKLLSHELADASTVVMVATSDDGAVPAAAIGEACTLRGVTTAGLILGRHREMRAAVSALRPHARILMVTEDERDIGEVLTALRA